MRRFLLILALAGALIVATAVPALAGPIDVSPTQGGVTVSVDLDGDESADQTLTAGLGGGEEGQPGLCAAGVLHTSCTPANQ